MFFTQAGTLRKHKLNHTGDQPYSCDTCGKGFTQAGNWKKHKLIILEINHIHVTVVVNILFKPAA